MPGRKRGLIGIESALLKEADEARARRKAGREAELRSQGDDAVDEAIQARSRNHEEAARAYVENTDFDEAEAQARQAYDEDHLVDDQYEEFIGSEIDEMGIESTASEIDRVERFRQSKMGPSSDQSSDDFGSNPPSPSPSPSRSASPSVLPPSVVQIPVPGGGRAQAIWDELGDKLYTGQQIRQEERESKLRDGEVSPTISDSSVGIARFRIMESYSNGGSVDGGDDIRTQVEEPFKSDDDDDEVESIDTDDLPLYDSLLALFSQPPSTATALTTSTTTIITYLITTTSIAPESSRPQRTKKLTTKAAS